MIWRNRTIVTLTSLFTLACSNDQDSSAALAAEQPQPADTAAAEPPVATPEAQPTPAPATPEPEPAPPPVASQVAQVGEVPWVPIDTGTVQPGWTAEDVVSVWGNPVLERSMGDWTYMYFRNGCEQACGTYDVLILQRNQVVDAIVRGRGHTYAGLSSSPPGRVAEFTPGTSTTDSSGMIG
jgi:hypothetical protein